MKGTTAATQRECFFHYYFFYATLIAKADTDSNKQTAGHKVKHETHSVRRLDDLNIMPSFPWQNGRYYFDLGR
jgi:hypothetical protein